MPPDQNPVSPNPVEETAENYEALIEEELIANDESFFWIFQRVVWGILQTVLFIGLIIGLVWFIWGGDRSNIVQDIQQRLEQSSGQVTTPSPNQKAQPVTESSDKKNPISEAEEKNTTESSRTFWSPFGKSQYTTGKISDQKNQTIESPGQPPSTTSNQSPIMSEKAVDNVLATELAFDAWQKAWQPIRSREQKEQNLQQDLRSRSMAWLVRTQRFGQIEIPNALKIIDSQARGRVLAQKLETSDEILSQSAVLQKDLTQQINILTQKQSIEQTEYRTLEEQLYQQISAGNVQAVDELTQSTITAKQKFVDTSTELEVYQSLQRNVLNFDKLIRTRMIPIYIPPTEISASGSQ